MCVQKTIKDFIRATEIYVCTRSSRNIHEIGRRIDKKRKKATIYTATCGETFYLSRENVSNDLTFLVIVHFVGRAEHAVRVIEKSGCTFHDHFVRVQNFLLQHLQRGHCLVKGIQILRNLAFLRKKGRRKEDDVYVYTEKWKE